MKSPRARTSQRRSSNKNSGKNTIRRSKRNKTLAINLNLAKRIVKEACFAAVNATTTSRDTNGKSSPANSSSRVENEINIDNDSNIEMEFSQFVASTISQAIVSICGTEKTTRTSASSAKKTTTISSQKPKKSRKRPRPLQSKVQGLEHADSLHTMCSLFPVLMPLGESSSNNELRAVSENSDFGFTTTTTTLDHREEPPKVHPSSPKHSHNHHSDHDSLLPPVGASSAATTPTKPLGAESLVMRRETIQVVDGSTQAIPHSPLKQQQQPQQHHSRIAATSTSTQALSPLGIHTTTEASSVLGPSSPSENRSNRKFLEKKNSGHVDIEEEENNDDDDDDYNYDRPLIGVVGDESSGLVGHHGCNENDYFDRSNGMDDSRDTEAIIHIAKVGTVVVHKTGIR